MKYVHVLYLESTELMVQKSAFQVNFKKEVQVCLWLLLHAEKNREEDELLEISKILNPAGFAISEFLSVLQFLIQPNKYYLTEVYILE